MSAVPKSAPVPPVQAPRPRKPRAVPKPRQNTMAKQLRPLSQNPTAPMSLTSRAIGNSSSTTLEREEVFTTLTSANNEHVTAYQLTPANPVLFPWLSLMSPMFSHFAVVSASVNFDAYCATTTSGRVVLAFTPDAEDSTSLLTPNDLNAFTGARFGTVREPFAMTIPTSLFALPRYALLTTGVANYNRFSSPGQILVGVSGGSAGLSYGTLRICYRIQMIAPQNPERPVSVHAAVLQQSLPFVQNQVTSRFNVLPNILDSTTAWIAYNADTGCYSFAPSVRHISMVWFLNKTDVDYVWQAETFHAGNGSLPTNEISTEANGGSITWLNFDCSVNDCEDRPGTSYGILMAHMRFTLSTSNTLGVWLNWNCSINRHDLNTAMSLPGYLWIYEW